MPPFSGRKKKEQLKAKRAKKREQNERERAYEEKEKDALYAESNPHHREEEEESNVTAPRPTHNVREKNKKDVNSGSEDEKESEEYMYGADRAGVRSVFKKESAAVIAARKQASYAPLTQRQVMPETGIAYGEWFHMPHSTTTTTLPAAISTHPLSDTASESFPVSVELPSRGWQPVSMDVQGRQVIRLVDNIDGDNEGEEDEEEEKGEEEEETTKKESEEEEEEEVKQGNETMTTRHVTAADIEAIEARRFARYVHTLEHQIAHHNSDEAQDKSAGLGSVLSSYERNLDVWRQLWRTVEVSEVIILVMDVRYPIVHLHLGLLAYILKEQRKPCVLLLNKIDLVPQAVVERWLAFIPAYLQGLGLMNNSNEEGGNELPEVALRTFTANPRPETEAGAESTLDVTRRQRKARQRRGKMYEQLRAGTMRVQSESDEDDEDEDEDNTYGPGVQFKGMDKAVQEMQKDKQAHRELKAVSDSITELLTLCKTIAARHTTTTTARQENNNTNTAVVEGSVDDSSFTHIGFVGFPNVGKSSLLNCIRGTKVVSVSATPGHTKHLQTIPLPQDEVTLVDSPGLALPMRGVPIPLQAVIGTHQIAQTRDPQSGVTYLATHLPLEKLYGLRRPAGVCDATEPWSAYELCEAYAQKRGFFVKHGKGALDIHRASIALLQEAYEGRLVLFFAPPQLALLETPLYTRSIRPHLLQAVLGTS